MKFQVQRETFLKPVQAVTGVVERRQTMPILSNLLLSLNDGTLSVTATDLEVELQSRVVLAEGESGDITVPGRKLLDICKALPENAQLDFQFDKNRLTVRSGKSRFTLSTLPAAEFPLVEDVNTQVRFSVSQQTLKRLLDKTQFAMAQQDVRYYLNGLLLELRDNGLRAVATDGHRMALSDAAVEGVEAGMQIIVPRKGVLELQRLLDDSDTPAEVEIGSNHIRIKLDGQQFTSKLIDGRFPEYERVIPTHSDKELKPERQGLREALQRTAILSNEKYRGVRLALSDNALKLQTHNPEQEEAEEELSLDYQGENLEIGFNVTYLMDALAVIESDNVTIKLSDANSSCLIEQPDDDTCRYVVMPMRL